MKAFVRRLFCCHLNWHKAFLPLRWPAWWQTEWECDHCGKRIVRDNNNPPVQFVSANAELSLRSEAERNEGRLQ